LMRPGMFLFTVKKSIKRFKMKRIILSLLFLFSRFTYAGSLDCPCRVVKIIDGDTSQ
jgi:hypothetical protein